MVIPKKLAIKYELDERCTVVLEEKDEGIFIRKLEI
jgi:bifunctional DNA-binding transcriptional regulator/antitoxin component of YhaV-PrlF toxin-antitoxin module